MYIAFTILFMLFYSNTIYYGIQNLKFKFKLKIFLGFIKTEKFYLLYDICYIRIEYNEKNIEF